MKSTCMCLHKLNVVLHCICAADISQISDSSERTVYADEQYKENDFSCK